MNQNIPSVDVTLFVIPKKQGWSVIKINEKFSSVEAALVAISKKQFAKLHIQQRG
jgi:hypothetical protein